MSDEPATPEQVAELGVNAVLGIAFGAIAYKEEPDARQEAIRRAVIDGRVTAGKGPGTIPASVLQALVRRGVLAWQVRAREADPSSAEISRDLLVRCRREWDRRRAPIVDVAAALVVEYLAALDARRALAPNAAPTGPRGKPLRGAVLASAIEAAQQRVDVTEAALRAAVRR